MNLNVNVSDEQKARWKEAADEDGLKLAEWIRQACDRATGGIAVRVRPDGGKVFKGPDPKPTRKS